jgi:thiol-disulfide isomerase/thioredoxin
MKPARTLAIAVSLAATISVAQPVRWEPKEGKSLVGTRAPEWRGVEWLQGGPLTLSSLRGKVVLVRFWLTDCALCAATAPSLRQLSERYRDRGLVVVGIHHPKSEQAKDPEVVAAAARAFGFGFPIGMDDEWQTVRAYGIGTTFKRFTSVSLLIDQQGIIRFVHDGGEFHAGGGAGHEACNAAFDSLVAVIETLCKNPQEITRQGGR